MYAFVCVCLCVCMCAHMYWGLLHFLHRCVAEASCRNGRSCVLIIAGFKLYHYHYVH